MNNGNLHKTLSYYLASQEEIQACDRKRMFQILEENYDFVNFRSFERDLLQKNFVLLLKNDQQIIQGFSTIAIDPGNVGTSKFSIIFSGDTIISPHYWGTQELVRGFGNVLGQLYAGLGGKKLYWFLISKGHRTYLYLPLFFKNYFPSPDYTDSNLESLVDSCSSRLFSNSWSRANGTIRFSSKKGQLKPQLAEATWTRSKNRHVQYFLDRNPSFYEGTELACMAEIEPENLLSRGRKFVLDGMKAPLKLAT